ncbi:MAG: lysophospholipid acyltransferase family protein [Terriglobales bacterium]
MKHLSWLRSTFLFWPAAVLITLIMEPFALLAGLLDRSGRLQHACVRAWAGALLAAIATKVSIRGMERIDASKPRLYAANHLSALDIPLLYRYLPFQFRIVAHRLVFRVPLIGWYLRWTGALEIAPESLALSRRTLREAVATLRRGMPIVIFPEGERSPTGEMLRFKRGAFFAAVHANVDVVPVAITGTYEGLPIGSTHLRRRPMGMIVGDPISTDGVPAAELAERTQAAVAKLLDSAKC